MTRVVLLAALACSCAQRPEPTKSTCEASLNEVERLRYELMLADHKCFESSRGLMRERRECDDDLALMSQLHSVCSGCNTEPRDKMPEAQREVCDKRFPIGGKP